MTDRPPTRLEALRAALVACGFLCDGHRHEDRVGLLGYGPDVHLVCDDPEQAIHPPCPLHALLEGVRPVVRTPDRGTAQRALHALARDLHRAGLWPPDTPPPPADASEMLVADDMLDPASQEGRGD